MEVFLKDEIEEIIKKGSVKDFLNFCEVNSGICTPDIWKRRLYHDYPFMFPEEFLRDPKYTYLKITEIISKGAEDLERTELENKNNVEYWFNLIVKNILYIFDINFGKRKLSQRKLEKNSLKHLNIYAPWLNRETHVYIASISSNILNFLNLVENSLQKEKEKDYITVTSQMLPTLHRLMANNPEQYRNIKNIRLVNSTYPDW